VPTVIAGVAEQDPNRALDIALALPPMQRNNAVQFVAMTAARQDSDVEAIANRLLALDDSQLHESLAFNVVSMWALRSPDAAMSWLLANGQSAPPYTFMQIGHQLAARDPRNAISYTSQVPADARGQWMQGIAQGYAQSDPQGAIGWLGQFRHELGQSRGDCGRRVGTRSADGAGARNGRAKRPSMAARARSGSA
jgi:hypothetical protein